MDNDLIDKLRVMDKQELNQFAARYHVRTNTLLACEEFIFKGARALIDIQRQLTRYYSKHTILMAIKTMPFYVPFHSMYCPEYNLYANIDELRAAVRHYDMFYANDSTAEELRDKLNNVMSLNTNVGASYFKFTIKLYLRFIRFAHPAEYDKISIILRVFYRPAALVDKKIITIENSINSVTNLIKDTRKRLYELKTKEYELQTKLSKKIKKRNIVI